MFAIQLRLIDIKSNPKYSQALLANVSNVVTVNMPTKMLKSIMKNKSYKTKKKRAYRRKNPHADKKKTKKKHMKTKQKQNMQRPYRA